MLFLFGLLCLIHITTPLKEIDLTVNNTSGHRESDNIICRGCGNDIAYPSSIISKITQSSRYSYYDSLFSKDEVLIQVLMNDFLLTYPIITTNQSNCTGISEWEEADSWFPGYLWKACVCPDCGALVGWKLKPINPNLVDQPERFFALIITNLIGESFIKSLTIIPGVQSIH